MSTKNKVEPIEIVDGETVFNLNASASNVDSIRSTRLIQKANKGDKKAEKKLAELDSQDMFSWD